jgi:Aerobic-type carbon monoxide dehydrogenase, large subunit CoxL/CutL homologs
MGGSAQGIGWALNEEYFYDDTGDLKNSSFCGLQNAYQSRFTYDRHCNRRKL